MNAKNNTIHSRGYQKLADAAKAFHFDFRGLTVLDIGSSTGGFTSYALNHGAKQVIAIEKGTRQMHLPLRTDQHLDLHEKTDIFTVASKSSKNQSQASTIINTPDVVLADVSFISLTKVLDYTASHLTGSNTIFLVMCKPQFEASPSQLSHGVVKNSAMRRLILKNFENWLRTHNFLILNKRDNRLAGKSGNLERFYLLKKVF